MLNEQWKGLMRHDVYSDVWWECSSYEEMNWKPEAFSQGTPIMHSTEFAF